MISKNPVLNLTVARSLDLDDDSTKKKRLNLNLNLNLNNQMARRSSSSSSSSRRSLVAAAAAAAALASGSTTRGVLAYSGSSGSYASSGCPFARLLAFSEKVSTPAGRRALLDKDAFSENPYLQPTKIFMKLGHEATLDFAKTVEGPVKSPIEQAASGLSEPAERDHSHGLTDAFVDAYVTAALAAHGLDFAALAAEDPVMSQRPGVKKLLLAKKRQEQKVEKSEEEAEEEDADGEESSSSSSSSLKEAAEGLLADAVRCIFVRFPPALSGESAGEKGIQHNKKENKKRPTSLSFFPTHPRTRTQ